MNYFSQAFQRTEKCYEENPLLFHEIFPRGVFKGLQEQSYHLEKNVRLCSKPRRHCYKVSTLCAAVEGWS